MRNVKENRQDYASTNNMKINQFFEFFILIFFSQQLKIKSIRIISKGICNLRPNKGNILFAPPQVFENNNCNFHQKKKRYVIKINVDYVLIVSSTIQIWDLLTT